MHHKKTHLFTVAVFHFLFFKTGECCSTSICCHCPRHAYKPIALVVFLNPLSHSVFLSFFSSHSIFHFFFLRIKSAAVLLNIWRYNFCGNFSYLSRPRSAQKHATPHTSIFFHESFWKRWSFSGNPTFRCDASVCSVLKLATWRNQCRCFRLRLIR